MLFSPRFVNTNTDNQTHIVERNVIIIVTAQDGLNNNLSFISLMSEAITF